MVSTQKTKLQKKKKHTGVCPKWGGDPWNTHAQFARKQSGSLSQNSGRGLLPGGSSPFCRNTSNTPDRQIPARFPTGKPSEMRAVGLGGSRLRFRWSGADKPKGPFSRTPPGFWAGDVLLASLTEGLPGTKTCGAQAPSHWQKHMSAPSGLQAGTG